MRMHLRRQILMLSLLLCTAPLARSGDDIPKAAWQRPIGLPVRIPAQKKPRSSPSTLTTDFGKARQWEDLEPALFRGHIAEISPAGT